MKEALSLYLPWLVLVVMALFVAWWTKYGKAERIINIVTKVTPDELDPFVRSIVVNAINAVDQKTKAYGTMTNAQRFELAKRYTSEVLAFFGHKDVSQIVIEALIEGELWLRHQVSK